MSLSGNMPKITVSKKDIENLIGVKIDAEELVEMMLMYLKADADKIEGDEITVKFEDTNRPDLWSAEGIARNLITLRGKQGKEYQLQDSNFIINVDDLQLKDKRPIIACALAKDVTLTDELVKSFMQTQDKLDTNYGRKRKKTSIGFYDLDKIKSPVLYTTAEPESIKFIPLNMEKEMTPKEILEKHPKGVEYANLVKDFDEYPILIDSENQILSMPPIINSNKLGNINESTKNLLIEVTGTDKVAVYNTLGIITIALADRGAKICSTTIKHKSTKKEEKTPDLEPLEFEIKPTYIEKKLGLKLSIREISKILEKMGYNILKADEKTDSVTIFAPFYRKDIMHPVDIIEDVAIGYGYNNIEPAAIKVPTIGELDDSTKKEDLIRDIMIGIGHQEVCSFMLTNKNIIFEKMNKEEKGIVELENPISSNWNVVRNKILPISMKFLAANKTVEFPQKIFELGAVVEPDNKEENKVKQLNNLCAAITHTKASFVEIKSVLDKLFHDLNRSYKIEVIENPSFISGRCAGIVVNNKTIGTIGEIHPQVIENFGLENPVAIFELNVDEL